MAETSTVMALAGAFIGIAIMLGIGVQILGNTTFDCTTLSGNWSTTCQAAETDTQNAYQLLLVILIVVAAVAILFVVRML